MEPAVDPPEARDTPRRFTQAFLALSVGITLVRLTTDRGGGDYFFTLVWLVLFGAAAPYLLALSAMKRTGTRLAVALGWAAVAFGVIDSATRVQAFYFPTERSGGGMALWLPIYSLLLIPLFALIVHTLLGVVARRA